MNSVENFSLRPRLWRVISRMKVWTPQLFVDVIWPLSGWAFSFALQLPCLCSSFCADVLTLPFIILSRTLWFSLILFLRLFSYSLKSLWFSTFPVRCLSLPPNVNFIGFIISWQIFPCGVDSPWTVRFGIFSGGDFRVFRGEAIRSAANLALWANPASIPGTTASLTYFWIIRIHQSIHLWRALK